MKCRMADGNNQDARRLDCYEINSAAAGSVKTSPKPSASWPANNPFPSPGTWGTHHIPTENIANALYAHLGSVILGRYREEGLRKLFIGWRRRCLPERFPLPLH